MKIALVAGEASGDLLGGLLMDGLKARWPQAQFVGIGGPQMVQRGLQAWWPSETLAVSGYADALKRLPQLLGIRKALRQRLLAAPPDVFIGIDAPDFNLALEAALKAAGIKTVHFVSPSIWAWRPERIETIRGAADHVLCIFPFEKPIYDQAGIGATYVGHPLASVIALQPDRAAARQALGLPPQATVLAVLPGSRAGEVRHLGPRFFEALRHVKQGWPAIECIVPCAPGRHDLLAAQAAQAGVQAAVRLVQGQSHAVLAACDVALVASGTATLEAALFKRPMVIAYNMSALSWRLMRRKQLQPWVGLPNILCREFVVPELLQHAATPPRLAQAVQDWLAAPQNRQAFAQRMTALHHDLRRDTATLAADAIEQVLRSGR